MGVLFFAYNLKVLLGTGGKYLLTFCCQYLCLYILRQISYIIQRVEFICCLKSRSKKPKVRQLGSAEIS